MRRTSLRFLRSETSANTSRENEEDSTCRRALTPGVAQLRFSFGLQSPLLGVLDSTARSDFCTWRRSTVRAFASRSRWVRAPVRLRLGGYRRATPHQRSVVDQSGEGSLTSHPQRRWQRTEDGVWSAGAPSGSTVVSGDVVDSHHMSKVPPLAGYTPAIDYSIPLVGTSPTNCSI